MEAEVIVPVVFFAFLGAIIVLPIWLREHSRRAGYRLIAAAIEKGQPLEQAVVRRLTKANPDRARHMLGMAVVLLALAGASFINRALVREATGEALEGLLMATVTLGALGTGFLLLSLFDYANDNRDQ